MKVVRIFMKCVLVFLTMHVNAQFSQEVYTPTAENLKSRAWFQDARFGLFIHWGVYSTLANGEWIMNTRQIPIKAYEKLPSFFNPTAFNAEEWVLMAKNAGMKYITFTSKHHDGFAMWDSKVSDYNVVKKTPYGKDIIKQLADACHKHGITLFLYHSQLDWHHPDYFPRGFTGGSWTGREEKGDIKNYYAYMDAQLTELLTNYGKIGGIWFDGMWDKKDADWQLDKTYKLIHTLQPSALIGSNHHVKPYAGEDFQMFEKDLPGNNSHGFAPDQEISTLPKEICETINGSWGFNLWDDNNKSTKELIQYLVSAAGYDANFLLNIGPMPNGKIQPEHIQRLEEIGVWLQKYGESIYGTRGGPITPRDWGVTTQRGKKVYLHLLKWDDESITIPSWGKKIKSVKLLNNQSRLKFLENDFGISLKIPKENREDIDTIIEIETD
jgi:alpha-L-fucosidase